MLAGTKSKGKENLRFQYLIVLKINQSCLIANAFLFFYRGLSR